MSIMTDKKKLRLSIIVPVYNIEKYLIKNIESLLEIKSGDVEFIYIDDGSPDHSVEILMEYQKRDDRIKIIRQKNGGLSAARNRGVLEARGWWTLFVDGDDRIDAKLVEEMLAAAGDENDIVCGAYDVVKENGTVEKRCCSERALPGMVTDGVEWMRSGYVMYTPCVYLYKTALLRDNGVLFPEGFLHEDMEFIPKVFYCAKNVKYVGFPYYKYVNREGSISRTKNAKRTTDLIRIAERLEQFEKDQVDSAEYRKFLTTYRAMICAQGIHIAILDGVRLQMICRKHRALWYSAIYYLSCSERWRDRIAAILLKWHMQWFYERAYLAYNALHRK